MSEILLTNSFKVSQAKAFYDALTRSSPSPEIFYQFFGRSDAWSDENVPPVPESSQQEEDSIRDAILAMKKISAADIVFVARRINWTNGVVYSQYSSTDPGLRNKNFYVITDEYNVYKCISNNSGVASTSKPTSTSPFTITTGDGYQWKFMFTVPNSFIVPFLTRDWIPVPVGAMKLSSQIAVENAATYVSGGPVGGHGSNAVEELFASNIMMTVRWDGSEDGIVPSDIDYRQIGLWANPLDAEGNPVTGNVLYILDSNNEVDVNTGRIIYIENRTAITRAADQVEQISIILEY